MLKMILGIMFIVGFHLLIFILFPDTGRYGDYYFYGLISLWSFLYLYLTTVAFFKKLPFKFIFKIVFFLIMSITSLTIIPQEDKKTILQKIISFNFPDSQQLERGRIKYINKIINIQILNITNQVKEDIKNKVNKLLREMSR